MNIQPREAHDDGIKDPLTEPYKNSDSALDPQEIQSKRRVRKLDKSFPSLCQADF